MDFTYNKHYITVNERGEIINGFSDAFRQPTDTDICINEQGGYQFRLIIDGKPTEENPPLFDFPFMIPLYKWTGTDVVKRTDEELAVDREAKARAAENAKWSATRLYEVGEYLTIDNTLYRVTLQIPSGGRISPNTNCVATTINDEMTKLNNH